MPRPAIDWVITDTHINHDLMLRVGRPPDYIERMRRNCAAVIMPQDTLYHLGDVIFYRPHELKPWLNSIAGRKVLLRGNHDKKSSGWFERNGFHYVADIIQLGKIVLSHKPLQSLPDVAEVNVHGHWHDKDHRRDEAAGWYIHGRHLKLAVEETGYRPVKLQEWVHSKIGRSI